MRILVWAIRLLLFFTLFAFALNNEQQVTVHWFFGYQWQAPLVIVVLASVAAGVAMGMMAMLPHWLRRRRTDSPAGSAPSATVPPAGAEPSSTPDYGAEHPPRIGL